MLKSDINFPKAGREEREDRTFGGILQAVRFQSINRDLDIDFTYENKFKVVTPLIQPAFPSSRSSRTNRIPDYLHNDSLKLASLYINYLLWGHVCRRWPSAPPPPRPGSFTSSETLRFSLKIRETKNTICRMREPQKKNKNICRKWTELGAELQSGVA